jgi:hypothetical protein
LPAKELELAELTSRSADPGLWNDQAAAQVVLRRADELREEISAWRELEARAGSLADMAELAAASRTVASRWPWRPEVELGALTAD